MLPDESRPRGGFIPAETLVQNGTAGDNGTGGGPLPPEIVSSLKHPLLDVSSPLGCIASGIVGCPPDRTPSTHGFFDFHFSSNIISIVIPI